MRSQKNTIRLMKTNLLFLTIVFVGCLSITSCGQSKNNINRKKEKMDNQAKKEGLELATFGTGCFWCTEAVFESLEGVSDVVSGYEGGQVKNPTYKEVCTGTTGHAECVQVTYDPKKISYEDLLQAFFRSHDPTSLNRQGADVGTQYRSAIFYHNPEQQKAATEIKQELDKSGAYSKPIVTEIVPTETFYVAEAYHQDYFANNPEQGYCAAVIAPKLDKFRKVFHDKLKKN